MNRPPIVPTQKPLHPLAQAMRLARDVCDALEPACMRIEIAGSVRRQKPMVADIEIVCVPKMVRRAGLLFDNGERDSLLDRRIAHLVSRVDPQLVFDWENRKNGPRWKRLRYADVPVDLFIVLPPAQWGVIATLRTGPAEWSHMVVTQRQSGGLLPDGFYCEDGALHGRDGRAIPCPTERDFFDALVLPWTSPAERTPERLDEMINQAWLRPDPPGPAAR